MWSDADRAPLAEARAGRPVAAAVHVATVRWDGAALVNDLALPPEPDAAVVIRLDDSVHGAWDVGPPIDADLDAALGRAMSLVHRRLPTIVEVQIDYDVPVRRLARWADALRVLRQGSLAGERVWVTSLVAHVREPAYGPTLRGLVDGHVLQLFDTGDDVGDAGQIAALARDAGLPWRLGLGAFERERTAHRAWFARAAEVCQPPLCDGVWVFPAGRSWQELTPPRR